MVLFAQFEINEFITLKLVDSKTIIYIGGEPFHQCKYLLLNVPITELTSLEDLNSVDEIADNLDKSLETSKSPIPPEVEFWGHCSNLQVWYENNYNTNLIHSNLAFPMLKKLTEIGDKLAKIVFKQEIIKRLEDGFDPTIWFLEDKGYLDYLTHHELIMGLLHPVDTNVLFQIESENNIKLSLKFGEPLNPPSFTIEDKRITVIELSNCNIKILPESIGNLTRLRKLYLENNELVSLPRSIGRLEKLERLIVNRNNLRRIPDTIGNLSSLRILNLQSNQLESLPSSIGKLSRLYVLDLEDNPLEDITNTL